MAEVRRPAWHLLDQLRAAFFKTGTSRVCASEERVSMHACGQRQARPAVEEHNRWPAGHHVKQMREQCSLLAQPVSADSVRFGACCCVMQIQSRCQT